jgi:glutaredoxin
MLQILNTMKVPYETVNILEDDQLRSGMKEYSQWPTFPQVYIGGEFFGGCDIMIGEDGGLPATLLWCCFPLHSFFSKTAIWLRTGHLLLQNRTQRASWRRSWRRPSTRNTKLWKSVEKLWYQNEKKHVHLKMSPQIQHSFRV